MFNKSSYTNIISGIISGFLIVTFVSAALIGLVFSGDENDSKRCVAKIKGQSCIRMSDLFTSAARMGQNFNKYTDNEKRQLLQKLLMQKINNNRAKDLGFHFSDSAIASIIKQQGEFDVDGNFSAEKFKKYINDNKIDVNLYSEFLKNNAISAILNDFFVSDFSGNSSYFNETINEKNNKIYNLKYYTLNYTKLDVSETPSDKELQDLYNQHKSSEFFTKPAYKEMYILTSSDLITQEPITDERILGFFDDMKANKQISQDAKIDSKIKQEIKEYLEKQDKCSSVEFLQTQINNLMEEKKSFTDIVTIVTDNNNKEYYKKNGIVKIYENDRSVHKSLQNIKAKDGESFFVNLSNNQSCEIVFGQVVKSYKAKTLSFDEAKEQLLELWKAEKQVEKGRSIFNSNVNFSKNSNVQSNNIKMSINDLYHNDKIQAIDKYVFTKAIDISENKVGNNVFLYGDKLVLAKFVDFENYKDEKLNISATSQIKSTDKEKYIMQMLKINNDFLMKKYKIEIDNFYN